MAETKQRSVGAILTVLVISTMVMILNETTLSIALSTIMADFNVTADVVQWLTTGFMLTMAIVIPTTGFLIQRFKTRHIYFVAMALFIIGSLMGALAPTFGVLLAARVIQACGTAIITPLLMTVTLTIVPPERRCAMMGINSIVISVAPALGPTIAGLILNFFTWHYLFWLMVPIAVICLVIGIFLLQNVGENSAIPFDVFSVILSALAFGGIVYGFSTIGQLISGTSSAPMIALLAGIVFLAIFVYRQIVLGKRGRALLDMSAFSVRNFTFSVITVFCAMAMMLGTVNVLPIYLQSALMVTPLLVGLLLLPGGLLQGIVSPFIGRIYDNVGPRPLAVPGAILMAGSQWWLYFMISDDTSLWLIITAHVIFNIGMALVMTPLMTVSLSSLPMNLYSHGSAIMNTLQQLGGAAGTAIMIAAMSIGAARASSAGMAASAAQAAGTQEAFLAGGILGIVAIAASFFVTALDKAPKTVSESAPEHVAA
ncbi:MDR family MFS transporter [Corynebacterium lubricantis]|uniref:MDR family MFS transporter n=1 Tax=Corynebacterium lubricantis TaxID=541095 RepID=UPI0003764464|nr:MDR family MFS transporter [Corynebacterium lubricantis]